MAETSCVLRVREAAMTGLHDVTVMLVNDAPALLEKQEDRCVGQVHCDEELSGVSLLSVCICRL